MEEEPEKPSQPVIPPPDLSMPPPPPPLPPRGTPPPVIPTAAPGDGPVKIKIRDGSEEETPSVGFAPFNTRAIAAVIDCLVASGLTMVVIFILPGFVGRVGWLVWAGYMVARDSLPFLGGQSVGKKAMKIKAVTLEDKSLVENWEVAAIRNGVLLIPFFPLIELFILLTREDKPERGRRLGDEWAKTKVILAPDPPAEEKVE